MTQQNVTLLNWMKNVRTTPAVYVEVQDVETLQKIVQDTDTFPSPVRAAGMRASPSGCHKNDGGTTIGMQKLNAILGFKHLHGPDGEMVQCVEAQAGVQLTDLQGYLQQHNLEMPFSAEIGIATLGGTCFTTTKDSTVGPVCPSGSIGDVASCLMSITVVEPSGELKEHSLFDFQGQENEAFQLLLDSQGTHCIAVSMCVVVRQKIAVETRLLVAPYVTGSELAAQLKSYYLQAREDGGNLFGMLYLKHSFALMEYRKPVSKQGVLNKVDPTRGVASIIKKKCFQECRFLKVAKLLHGVSWTRDSQRKGFRYPADVPESKRRLTFAYYSFDFAEFDGIVDGALKWISSYKHKTGFIPEGIAVYFVTRNGKRVAGPYAGKGAGTSFSFDPVYYDPLDPQWTEFVREFNIWVRDNGGIPSLNQTPEIELLPEWGARCLSGSPQQRFCNKWMMNFMHQDLAALSA